MGDFPLFNGRQCVALAVWVRFVSKTVPAILAFVTPDNAGFVAAGFNAAAAPVTFRAINTGLFHRLSPRLTNWIIQSRFNGKFARTCFALEIMSDLAPTFPALLMVHIASTIRTADVGRITQRDGFNPCKTAHGWVAFNLLRGLKFEVAGRALPIAKLDASQGCRTVSLTVFTALWTIQNHAPLN